MPDVNQIKSEYIEFSILSSAAASSSLAVAQRALSAAPVFGTHSDADFNEFKRRLVIAERYASEAARFVTAALDAAREGAAP